MNWTEELKEEVKSLWNTTSAREIAETLEQKHHIKVTRNMVIGVCSRMGLSAATKTVAHPHDTYAPKEIVRGRPERTERGNYKPRKRLHIVASNAQGGYRLTETVETEMPRFACIGLAPLNKALIDLGDNDCRYIAGDPRQALFCGHPVAPDKSWCPLHCSRVFKPVEPSKVRAAA